MAQSPPDLAVLSPFLAQSLSLSHFLRHPQRNPHFARRSGDQCDDVRRHRRVRDAFGGRDPRWVGFVWYSPYRSWCLCLYHVMNYRLFYSYFCSFGLGNLSRPFSICGLWTLCLVAENLMNEITNLAR